MLAALLSVLSLTATLTPPPSFTTAAEVRSLPIPLANTPRKVRLAGGVTFSLSRSKYFYLQDKTGGVRVEWPEANRDLQPGELVQVIGTTTGGTFLPEVKAEWVLSTSAAREEC